MDFMDFLWIPLIFYGIHGFFMESTDFYEIHEFLWNLWFLPDDPDSSRNICRYTKVTLDKWVNISHSKKFEKHCSMQVVTHGRSQRGVRILKLI